MAQRASLDLPAPSGPPPAEALWHRALDSLGLSRKHDLAWATVPKGDAVAAVLDMVTNAHQLSLKKRWKIKRSTGDEVIIRDVFEKIISWINRFRAVGDAAVQYAPMYASLPWAAIRFLLQIAVNDTMAMKSMIDDLELVTRLIARFREYEHLHLASGSHVHKLLEDSLISLYASILQFLASAIKFFKEPTAVRMLKAPFRSVDEESRKQILHKESEILKLTSLADTERLLSIETQIVRLSRLTLDSQSCVSQVKYTQMLEWLSCVPYSSHHTDHQESRIPGTGEWLFRRPQYQEWLSSSCCSLFLVHGIPGCGKTSLCSAVVDNYLQRAAMQPDSAPLAYYYCSAAESEPERHSPEGVLRSLTRQLTVSATAKCSVHNALSVLFDQKLAKSTTEGFQMERLRLSECIETILDVLDSDPANIVVDAIDEIDEPKPLLDAFNEITRRSKNVVKIFLTSRDNSRILALLSHAVKLRITASSNSEDVLTFASHAVESVVADRRLLLGAVDSVLREQLVNALASGAGEMFLWAKLQLNRLCLLRHEDDLRNALPDLARSTIEELYLTTFQQIQQAGAAAQEIASRTFAWLLYVCDPLSPDVFLSAISSPYRWQQPDLTSIVNICRNFIYYDAQSDVLRFAHQSVQEFLLSQPAFAPQRAQKILAASCVAVCSDGPSENVTRLEPSRRVYDYAALYWGHHCAAVENSDDSIAHPLQADLESFLFDEDGPGLPATLWLETIKATKDFLAPDHPQKISMEAVVNANSSPLFAICTFGLTSLLLQHDWPNGFDWNQTNDSDQTPLYVASYFGQSHVVPHLISRGANVNIKCGKYGSALHCAAFKGHTEVSRLLLLNDANPNVGVRFPTAFHAACRGDQEDTALLLLNNGLEILTQPAYESMLHAAAEAGFARVIKFLQKHVFSYHISPSGKMQTCIKAIEGGKLASLRAFFKGACLLGNLPEYAVAISALHGHVEMTAYLLDQGFDIETAGDLGSPLRCASLGGYPSVLRLLLERGAEVDKQGKYGSALHAASQKGHVHAAKVLIDAGANVNAPGGPFGNALQAAAFHGHTDMARLLMKSGADVYGEGFAKSAIHAAAEGGSFHVLKLFIDHDLTLHPQSTSNLNFTLSAAASSRKVAVPAPEDRVILYPSNPYEQHQQRIEPTNPYQQRPKLTLQIPPTYQQRTEPAIPTLSQEYTLSPMKGMLTEPSVSASSTRATEEHQSTAGGKKKGKRQTPQDSPDVDFSAEQAKYGYLAPQGYAATLLSSSNDIQSIPTMSVMTPSNELLIEEQPLTPMTTVAPNNKPLIEGQYVKACGWRQGRLACNPTPYLSRPTGSTINQVDAFDGGGSKVSSGLPSTSNSLTTHGFGTMARGAGFWETVMLQSTGSPGGNVNQVDAFNGGGSTVFSDVSCDSAQSVIDLQSQERSTQSAEITDAQPKSNYDHPLVGAAARGHVDVVSLLLEHADRFEINRIIVDRALLVTNAMCKRDIVQKLTEWSRKYVDTDPTSFSPALF